MSGAADMESTEASRGAVTEAVLQGLGPLPAWIAAHRATLGSPGGLARVDSGEEAFTWRGETFGGGTKPPHLAPHVDHGLLQAGQAADGLQRCHQRYTCGQSQ